MKAIINDNQGAAIFDLEGALTRDACNQLRQKITELLARPHKAIVFNMEAVPFIDSAGLELLIWIRDYCQLSVVHFRLAGLTEHCLKILEMTRLNNELHCSEGLETAMSSLT